MDWVLDGKRPHDRGGGRAEALSLRMGNGFGAIATIATALGNGAPSND